MQQFDCSAQPAGLSGAERRRFTVEEDSTGPPVLDLATTDSNTWLEVNYTQLVATGRRLLPRVKPGTIAMAMVKVGSDRCFLPRVQIAAVMQPMSLASVAAAPGWMVNYRQLMATVMLMLLPGTHCLEPGQVTDCRTELPMQGGGYGHGVVTAAKAFLESGYAEIGTGDAQRGPRAQAERRHCSSAPVLPTRHPVSTRCRACTRCAGRLLPLRVLKHLPSTAGGLSLHSLHADVKESS